VDWVAGVSRRSDGSGAEGAMRPNEQGVAKRRPGQSATTSGLRDGSAGAAGEEAACRFLEGIGLSIVARNVRFRGGEIDVVAREGETTVFVEVKERSGESHGEGFESVTAAKRRRVIRAAVMYASAHGLYDAPIRFDVVSVSWSDARPGTPRIRHDRNAFDASGR
jgi:putative endonuclease